MKNQLSEFGNYSRQKDWSDQAQKFFSMVTAQSYDFKNSKLKSQLANYYGPDHKRQAERLLDTLIEDIWLSLLPTAACREALLSNRADLDQAITQQLYRYGNLGVVYTLNKKKLPNIQRTIARDVYLTPNRGIPIRDFLLWYKGYNPDLAVLQEWSGIPKQEMNFVYRSLIKQLRRCLESDQKPNAPKKTRPRGEITIM